MADETRNILRLRSLVRNFREAMNDDIDPAEMMAAYGFVMQFIAEQESSGISLPAPTIEQKERIERASVESKRMMKLMALSLDDVVAVVDEMAVKALAERGSVG